MSYRDGHNRDRKRSRDRTSFRDHRQSEDMRKRKSPPTRHHSRDHRDTRPRTVHRRDHRYNSSMERPERGLQFVKKSIVHAGDSLETDMAIQIKETSRRIVDYTLASPEDTSQVLEYLLQCSTQLPGKQWFYSMLLTLLHDHESFLKIIPFTNSFISTLLQSLHPSDPQVSLSLQLITQLCLNNVFTFKDTITLFHEYTSIHPNSLPAVISAINPFIQSYSIPQSLLQSIQSQSREIPSLLLPIDSEISLSPFKITCDSLLQAIEEKACTELFIGYTSTLRNQFMSTSPPQELSIPLGASTKAMHEFHTAIDLLPTIAFITGTSCFSLKTICQLMALQHVLIQLHKSPKRCVSRLLSLESQLSTSTLLLPLIIANALALPKTNFSLFYYARLTVELLQTDFPLFGPIFGKNMNLLFTSLDLLDAEAMDRFIKWFSYNLQHFELQWPWEKWQHALSLGTFSTSQIFIRSVLQELSLYLYREQITTKYQDMSDLVEALPPLPEPVIDRDHLNEYCDDKLDTLIQLLESKASLQDVDDFLENYVSDDFSSEVLISVLLQLGASSYTHVFKLLERYEPTLQSLSQSEENRAGLARAVFSVWSSCPQHIYLITERCLLMQLVDSVAITGALFDESSLILFQQPYLWRLVETLVAYNSLEERDTRQPKDFLLLVYQRFHSILSSTENDDPQLFQLVTKRMHQFARLSMPLALKTGSIKRVHSLLFSRSDSTISETFTPILQLSSTNP